MKIKKIAFIDEFRKFITRGNVVDLAVGVIIGASFQSIVSSVVSDLIMPLVGWLFGDIDFSNLFIVLGKLPENADPAKLSSLSYVRDELGCAVFAYGAFITAVINFLILAFVICLLVKGINAVKSKFERKEEVAEENAEPTTKTCPYCKTEINIEATRCPHCTSEL